MTKIKFKLRKKCKHLCNIKRSPKEISTTPDRFEYKCRCGKWFANLKEKK